MSNGLANLTSSPKPRAGPQDEPGQTEADRAPQDISTFTTGPRVTAEKAVLFLDEVPTENNVLPLLCIFPANPVGEKAAQASCICPQTSSKISCFGLQKYSLDLHHLAGLTSLMRLPQTYMLPIAAVLLI